MAAGHSAASRCDFFSGLEQAHLDNVLIEPDAKSIPGDINCDGDVNLLDVAPFVDILSSGEFDPKADINQDGEVNLLDVDPFVNLLSGG